MVTQFRCTLGFFQFLGYVKYGENKLVISKAARARSSSLQHLSQVAMLITPRFWELPL